MSYVDVLYIYAIARAGYIPQLFSLRLPNPEVIYELLAKADGKAIIYEPELADTVSNCPCPAYSAGDLRNVDIGDAPVPPMPRPSSADDIAMIFHTSGSTSGRPKLLPCNYKWLDAMVDKSARTSRPLRKDGQDVTVAMYVPSSPSPPCRRNSNDPYSFSTSGEACVTSGRRTCSSRPSRMARARSSHGL